MEGDRIISKKNIEELFDKEEFNEINTLLSSEFLETQNDAELYLWKGIASYYGRNYENAINNYNKALALDPNYELAYYNRGLAWFAKKEYNNAIKDYSKAISFSSISTYQAEYYTDRGNVWRAKKKYAKAISDYSEAIRINSNFENSFYSRGLAKKEEGIDLEGSKQDFENYLKLTTDKKENWIKYAKHYIEDIDVILKEPELQSIRKSINDIKNILTIREKYIAHYTSLSVLKSLVLDDSKFRISEGNYLNDPSEGKEFFSFLKYSPHAFRKRGSSYNTVLLKPFIGSFVMRNKNDDLNLWRFYGKEKGVEAKGCAITLCRQEFIDKIKDFLSNEKIKDARIDDESDATFYRVVYISNGGTVFINTSLSTRKIEKLKGLLVELISKVRSYKGDNNYYLEKCLNNIAFLFKSDAYKYEHEVRLVINGIEFEKKYFMDIGTPRVYIELVSIKDVISKITLGPKVDKVGEWIAAFNYSFENNIPKIVISRLPYK